MQDLSHLSITTRTPDAAAVQRLQADGIPPLLARVYASRGVRSQADIDYTLGALLPPDGLKGMTAAAALLADAIAQNRHLCVVADYDCDGATACATAVRGLRLLGARHIDYLVPDRIQDGYGLTPAIARRVAQQGADVLITVDNGIASVDGVAEAKALGMQVLVTDHHLPGEHLPAADAIVNPNQPGCNFACKSMAGVGVMFYVLLAVRALLRQRGVFAAGHQPRLDTLLPLVALGTVADVVPLQRNNRVLVAQGIQRIQKGHAPAGILALCQVASTDYRQLTSSDFGFRLGPRINAAGRLSDMRVGIECLLSSSYDQALLLAQELDTINRERRTIESGMLEQALQAATSEIDPDAAAGLPNALAIFDSDFHEGVVGIVASRLKDRYHRPCFVFAPSQAEGNEHVLKGSGRSVAGFHLRDALDWIAKKYPGVLQKFGGHAMAAGCTVGVDDFDTFAAALAEVAALWLNADDLGLRLETDGALKADELQLDMAEQLGSEVWGQGFAPPSFSQQVRVCSQRTVGENHSKLRVDVNGMELDAIWFRNTAELPESVHMAYQLDVNEWRGRRSVQLIVSGVEL